MPEPATDRPRRLLFVSHSAGRTGAPIILLSFLRWLKANTPHQFAVVLQMPGPLLGEFAALAPTVNLDVARPVTGRLARYARRFLQLPQRRQAKQIRDLFARGPFDAVYANTFVNGNVLHMLPGRRLPTLTHVHEMDYWVRRAGKQNMAQVRRYTSEYVAVSQAVKSYLTADCGIPAERVSLVYEFVESVPPLPSPEDRLKARQRLGIPPGALVLGGCGSDYWRKGRDLIVHLLMATRRRESARPIHFVWVGPPGTKQETEEMAFDLRKAGVQAMFHATGEVADPFLYYPAFDLFTLLSRDDPFPLVCLEAGALGIPVVCFDGAGGIPEFVGGDAGFVVPYLDVDAMAEKAVLAARSPDLLARFGACARRKVLARHTVASAGPELLGRIDALIAGAAPEPTTPCTSPHA